MGEARVSVVVPLFQGERYVEETIRSVLAQSLHDLEVVVVDDGSRDEGPSVVEVLAREDSRVRMLRTAHSGIADTRNSGLAALGPASRYVLFLDQDDLLAADLLAGLVSRLERRSDAVGAYALADFIDAAGEPLGDGWFADAMRTRRTWRDGRIVAPPPEEDVRWPETFMSNHLYPPSAVLLRRDAVSAVGGLSTAYAVADDWDLMLRLLRLGPILPWDAVKVGYRRHSANASSNTGRNIRETRAVWANTYHSRSNSTEQRRQLRGFWRAHQRATASRKLAEAWELAKEGRLPTSVLRAADGMTHAVLPFPLRSWRSHSRRRA